jgi:long-chain fatty acid transport protein
MGAFMVCRSIRPLLTAGTALAAMTLIAVEAQAGAFALREQSAVGQGMSFAGEGTPGMGLSAMFWNSAAVTQATGLWSETHITGIFPGSTVHADPGTSPALLALGTTQDNAGPSIAASSYYAYQFNPNLYFGLAVTSPYGLATGQQAGFAAQQLSVQSHAFSIDVNPIIGWKVNESLSIGVGPRLTYFRGQNSRALAAVNPALLQSVASLDVDDIGFGWTAGITWKPWWGSELALGYRSRVNLDLNGHIDLPPVAPVPGTNSVNTSAVLPDQVSFGVRQRITDSVTLLGTVEWTHWGLVQNEPFVFTSGPATGLTATTITFNYRDGWFFSGGGEYQWSPTTVLRAGVGYEISPITDAIRDPGLPDANRWWLSAGISYTPAPFWTFDIGFSYILVSDAPINVVPGHPDFANLLGNTFIGNADTNIAIVSAALRYKFSGGEPPLVTKN